MENTEAERYAAAASILPGRIRKAAMAIPEERRRKAEELRLRAGKRPTVLLPEGEIPLPCGPVEPEELETLCDLATEFSRYAAAETIRWGYLSVRGGFRVGLCGSAVMKEGQNTNLIRLSSAAVRIGRERKGIAREVAGKLFRNGSFASTLLLSPPGGGKTTLLRDLVRELSSGGAEANGRAILNGGTILSGEIHPDGATDPGGKTESGGRTDPGGKTEPGGRTDPGGGKAVSFGNADHRENTDGKADSPEESAGNPDPSPALRPPQRIALIDERGEVAVMTGGLPQMDVGSCTDILDGCPKAIGIPMVLRAMNPQIIAVDEITIREDLHAVMMAAGCGVRLLATIHASSAAELRERPLCRDLLETKVFQMAVRIRRNPDGTRRYDVEELE